jgi:hypothetical protein
MATTRYEETLRQVQSLSPADQKRLLLELAEQLGAAPEEATSILQLQGLGKEIWRDLDAQEYVDQERASWNG